MDLDAPLRPDEIVKAPQAYTRVYPSQQKQGPLVPRPPTTFEPRLVAQQQEPAVKLVKEKKKKTGKKTTTATAVAKLKKKKSLPESSASKSNLFNMDDWLDGSNGNVPIDSTLEMKSTLNVRENDGWSFRHFSGKNSEIFELCRAFLSIFRHFVHF